MKELFRGTVYQLENFNSESVQTIQFVNKVNGENKDGTINEELIDVLISRYDYLQSKSWNKHNEEAITLLYKVKGLMRKRLEEKKKRLYGDKKIGS